MNSLDAALLDLADDTSLVSIGRQRRLLLDDSQGARHVDLCWVDEVVLVLIAQARSRGLGLTIVYPAPAGQVGVLLAAQILLDRFVRGNHDSSVGIVTADAATATNTWNALRISTTGARVPIADVFGPYRAGPDGESPWGGRRLRGVIIGQKCTGWPVDHLVVDHLAGLVRVDTAQPSIEVFADPGDPGLREVESEGRLIWGWSRAGLAANNHLEVRADDTTPFSVASERLDSLAGGAQVRLRVARHPEAEAAVGRAREDLRVLRSLAPDRSDRNLERGLSAAWHYLSTLDSLPCRPSQFDRFAGLPPMAARATSTFAPELSGWANTLSGDVAEIASILATDIADLRAALELGNPLEQTLHDVHASGVETLVITRTATAARALWDLLGYPPGGAERSSFVVQPIRRLHRQGTWPHALMIGEPSPWDWHRLLSGLAPSVEVLTLGMDSARSCASSIASIETARDRWGGSELRERTWFELMGVSPPDFPEPAPLEVLPVMVLDGVEYVAEPDPFGEFATLFDVNPLDITDEGLSTSLAHQDESGIWNATAPAVAVETDRGRILLEVGRPVDVQEDRRIIERRPELLKPGDILLVGSRQGRVGLLEALEERLSDKPDLLAARFLVEHYHRLVRSRFGDSRFAVASLHDALVERGCARSEAAVRTWVTGGTMAPRDYSDLVRLNDALGLGLSPERLRELFAGVQRLRGFRRAAGRILAEAARDATVVSDESRVDVETGLSIADLRTAVVRAEVVDVTRIGQPVPVALLGRLET